MKLSTPFRLIFASLSILLFAGAIVYTSCSRVEKMAENPETADGQVELLPDHIFKGGETCRECHQKEYDEWEGSHHDLAMQIADSTSVLGNFNDIIFTSSSGMKTRFYRKGKEFWVNTEDENGDYRDYKVIYTFGVIPLQQYIVEFPSGRFQCLSTAWDVIEKRWFDLHRDLQVVHSEWLHQSRGAMNWNTMCADCHSTNVRKNFRENTDSYNTQYSIINVSCEACHGPGTDHVKKVKQNSDNYALTADEKLFLTKSISSKEQVDQCARCHSRREQLTKAYNFNGTYMDHYNPQLLTEGMYHPDGQILDEVYVYGSFAQSKMYMNNVKCTNCHDPHTLQLKYEGNKLCQQCHVPEKYDNLLHTQHLAESEGSKCVNCHMVGKNYMVNDYRRDHSFRIPRPDLSLKYNTPNACNQCHTDKKVDWAWQAYQKWYGLRDTIHYTDVLSLARAGDPSVINQLVKLSSNKSEPPIVRATAIHYLGDYSGQEGMGNLVTYLQDIDPMIKSAAIEALNEYNLSGKELQSLYQLLNDEVRVVRIKAFRALAGVPSDQIPLTYQPAYQKAKQEFLDYLQVTADFSAGQANKAIYFERIGDVDNAIRAYQRALEIDDHNNQVRNNLANLYYQKSEFDKAEAAFRKIIEQEPEYGYTYYSLGLLLAEKGELEEAVPAFEMAIQLIPENPRIYYNLGLIFQNRGEMEKAESIFTDGLRVAPKDEGLLYAITFFYANALGDKKNAIVYAEKLVESYPGSGDYRQLLQQLRNQ